MWSFLVGVLVGIVLALIGMVVFIKARRSWIPRTRRYHKTLEMALTPGRRTSYIEDPRRTGTLD
jgi:regulator of protease activity HflC (stomatin/prohibitin superfamily)